MFADELKSAEAVPVYKKRIKKIKTITDPSVFFQIYQKFTKNVCKNN